MANTFWYHSVFTETKSGALMDAASLAAFLVEPFRVLLTTAAYQPDPASHKSKLDIDSSAICGGPAERGILLTHKSLSFDEKTKRFVFDADDAIWRQGVHEAMNAVIYLDTGVDETSPLLACVEFGEPLSSDRGPFVIQWGESGMLHINLLVSEVNDGSQK